MEGNGRWPMVQQIYGKELRSTDVFAVDRGDGKGQLRWETLAKRVTEHVIPISTEFLMNRTFE
jgi:26S proteasome regulatory subunit N5